MRTKFEYNCINCRCKFFKESSPSSINGKRTKFCSKKCYNEFLPKLDNSGRFKKGERPSFKTEFKKGFIPWNKGKPFLQKENHPLWKGGKIKVKEYIVLRIGNKYFLEHRLIMQNHIGRKLKNYEVVHHIDGNKENNNLDNLKLFNNQSEHRKEHASNALCFCGCKAIAKGLCSKHYQQKFVYQTI